MGYAASYAASGVAMVLVGVSVALGPFLAFVALRARDSAHHHFTRTGLIEQSLHAGRWLTIPVVICIWIASIVGLVYIASHWSIWLTPVSAAAGLRGTWMASYALTRLDYHEESLART